MVLRVEELENRSAPANLLHDLSLLAGLPNQRELLPASSAPSIASSSYAHTVGLGQLESVDKSAANVQQHDIVVLNSSVFKDDGLRTNTNHEINQLFIILKKRLGRATEFGQ